eukprot:scaffold16240_cov116-Skeletonema_dohrnii-CCMP3373.AAC.5
MTILVTILTITLSTHLTTASSSFLRQYHRHLDFNSYWNGEWEASTSGNYECQDCDDAQLNNSNNNQPSDMWVDDNIQQFMSEEYLIIRNVSLGLLGLLLLSCCMCYPECLIITVTSVWKKVNCCCPQKEEEEEDGGGEYVGGKMTSSGGRKMKKKRSKNKGMDATPGLAPNSDVELDDCVGECEEEVSIENMAKKNCSGDWACA